MNAMILMIATSAMGVNPGWQPSGDGGLEYIIQIEPDFCEKFPPGGITSAVPPDMLNSINRIRIVVGNESSAPLPHENLPAAVRPIPIQSNTPRPPADNSLEPRGGVMPKNQKEPFESNGNQNGLPYTQPREMPGRNDGNTEASVAPRIQGTFADGKNTQQFTGFPPDGTAKNSPEPERPWWALTGCLVALFASLGGNLYQGLAHFNLRQRYQSLIQRVQSPARA